MATFALWLLSYALVFDFERRFNLQSGESRVVLARFAPDSSVLICPGGLVYVYPRTIRRPPAAPVVFEQSLDLSLCLVGMVLGAYPALSYAAEGARRRRRIALGRCPVCDYCLRGSPGPVCPECGTPMAAGIGGEKEPSRSRVRDRLGVGIMCAVGLCGTLVAVALGYLAGGHSARFEYSMAVLLALWSLLSYLSGRRIGASSDCEGSTDKAQSDGRLRMLCRGARWGATVLSVAVLTLYASTSLLYWRMATTDIDPSVLLLPYSGPLSLCRAHPASDLGQLDPNSVLVLLGDLPRLRVTLKSDKEPAIASVGVTDEFGRWWVEANVEDGTHYVSEYPEDDRSLGAEPTVTYRDTDGDGILDYRLDWQTRTPYVLAAPPAWEPYGDK